MATSNNDRISSQRLLDTLKGLQASRHLGGEPEVDPQTNEKTKHTIKQDYLPNADWNVNDPDADGYVQGRTHWSEISETEANVNVQSGAQMGNIAVGVCDKFGAVKGFTYPTGEYDPGRIGEIIEIVEDGMTMQVSYVGEDANGNAITPTSYADITRALQNTHIGIMLLKEEDNSAVYIAYPNVAANDECTATIVSENVHKLDRKFYEYVDGDAITEYVEESIKSIESDTRIDGPQYFAVGYNYGYHYSTTLKDKIVEINNLELVSTNPHQLWLKKGRYSNINSMENGDFLVCNSQGSEFYTGKNIKTPVAGSPYRADVEETDITTFDTFIPLWRKSTTGAAHPYYVIVNNDNNFVPRVEDRRLIGTAGSSFPSDCKIFFICYQYPTYQGGADPLDEYYGATKAIKNQQGQITMYYTEGNSREIYNPYEPNGTGIYVRRIDGRSGISRGNETLLRPFKLTQQHETITINEDEQYWTDNVEFYYYYRSNGINKRGKAITSVAKEGNNYTISITFDNEETDIYVWCEPIPSIPLNCYAGVGEFLNDYFLTLASHQK